MVTTDQMFNANVNMGKVSLKCFLKWARLLETQRPENIVITAGEASDNSSARIDFDTEEVLARISFWESGDYYAEIIEIESEETTYSEKGVAEKGDLIASHFEEFFEKLEAKSSK